MRYYIADCHFFHQALNTGMDRRGFSSAEEMNRFMIGQWNDRVRDNDDVIILGDFSFGDAGQTTELLQTLKGRKYLIKGNHDKYLGYRHFDESLFQWVKSYEELQDNKRKVILCHYPVMCYNGQYRLDKEGNPRTWMLYGHVHNTRDQRLMERFIAMMQKTVFTDFDGNEKNIPCQMINCFCGFSGYTPLTLDEWIENDKKRREN